MATYFFNDEQILMKIVSDDATLSNKQTQELSDGLLNDYLTVTVINDEELLNSEYVAVKSNQGNEQTFDMYRITNVQTNDDATTFTGIQLAYYELAGYVVEDIRPVNRTVSYVASQLLNGTEWRVGYVENNLPNVTDRFYYLSAKDSFTKLQEIANCEVVFKVEISGQGVTDKWVEIYSQLGDRTLKRFNYGSNALTIEREIGKNDIYTALIGRGKGEEAGDGYGRKLTFEDVVWSTANGNPVNKPKGQKYIELTQATAEYGIKTSSGKVPRIGIVEFDETEDANVLIRETYNALIDVARPKVQFKSTIINIGSTNIGDTVTIHRHDLNIHYETRVYKVVRDKLDDDFTEVTLGDAVTQSSTRKQTQFYNTINNLQSNQSELATQVNYIGQTADRKNAINWGNNEPQFKRTGDLWYRDHPSIAGEKQMLIWNGEGWDIALDTSIENSVAEEVEAVWQEMDANKTATEQAINQAITDANAYAEQQTSALKTEVEASNEILDAAISAAQNRADAAFADAEIAKNNAFAATQTAQTAINDSITAINNAQTALDSITAISGDLSELDQSVQNKFTSIDGQISNMVTQTTFNALDQKVTSQGTLISQTQTTLLSKADKTDVDVINQTVSQHTTKIEQNAQAITARLTETQINNLLGTKNYVNQTTLTATANGLNASITQVSNDLSNLEFGGRNLVIRHNEQVGKSLHVDGSINNTSGASLMEDFIAVTPNEVLTFSKTDGGDGYWRWNWYDSDMKYISRNPDNRNEFQWSVPSNAYYIRVSYPTGATVQIERGTKATDWTPAPEDMATLEQFTTINATIQGLQTTVGNKAEQSQVTQLAGQISSKVESSTYTSKMTQLDNAIQSKVDSATYSSKMTQLDSAISLRVTQNQVTEAILADKTIKDTRNDNQAPYWYMENYPKQEVREFKLRTILGLPGSSTYVQLTTKVPWAGGTSGGVPVQIAESTDGTYQRKATVTGGSWLAWDKIAETGKLISEINISTEGILIAGKRIRLDGEVTMEQAFISRLDTLTLNAVTANITTIRSQVLQANVVTSTHLQTSTATIEKLFATDAMVTTLTAKAAFISSIKTIDLSATKITTGTLNASNVSIINLNADSIATGTISGANSSWSLNTGMMNFTNPSTGDQLRFTQGQIEFQNGAQTRMLQYNAEGLQLRPGTGNTGTSRNTSLHLIGGGVGSYQYIQFISGDGFNQRLETVGNSMTLQHASGGLVLVKAYGADNHSGIIRAARFETSDATGDTLEMDGDQIRTPRDGSRNIFLTPQGTGAVIAGASGGIRYNVNASDFVKQSSRTTKTNIVPLQGGLDVINALIPVSYNKIDKLTQGIYEVEKGFISEDSPTVATPDRMGIYDSHITAHLVKAVQELDVRATSETEELKAKIAELERKISQLESAA